MKTIKNFSNYLIHSDGRIINKRTGRTLKISKNQKGYHQIQLSNNGKSKTITIHRLVYTHFVSDVPVGLEINHIDGNKNNNHVSNLEVVTKKDNMRKAVLNGQIKTGEDCCRSVSVAQINPVTNKVVKTFGSINIATKETKISGSGISNVINGHRLSAGGFLWKKI